jgi:hypothetical protein
MYIQYYSTGAVAYCTGIYIISVAEPEVSIHDVMAISIRTKYDPSGKKAGKRIFYSRHDGRRKPSACQFS